MARSHFLAFAASLCIGTLAVAQTVSLGIGPLPAVQTPGWGAVA